MNAQRPISAWLTKALKLLKRSVPYQQASATPISQIVFFPFEEGAILFSPISQQLWTLNTGFAYTWCMLHETASPEEIALKMVQDFGISLKQARSDVRKVIIELLEEGLLEESDSPVTENRVEEPDKISFDSHKKLEVNTGHIDPIEIQIRNFTAQLKVEDEDLVNEFTRVFEHFIQPAPKEGFDTEIAVLNIDPGEQFDLYIDTVCVLESVNKNEVLPYLFGYLFVRCMEMIEGRLLFHSAALGKKDRAILFPGTAGSGKSTLSTVLSHHGWTYLTDELAIVNRDSLEVEPLPLAIKLKEGSYSTAREYYPEFDNYPDHYRIDQKYVRMVNPHKKVIADTEKSFRPGAIVFPIYSENEKSELKRISKEDAIKRLFKNRIHTRNFIDQDIETFIKMISVMPSYELIHNDTSEMLSIIDRLQA